MKANLKVKRFDPEDRTGKVNYQEYSVEAHPDSTVLDVLTKIRDEIDGTLALRCSCRASICGSCGMKVNGRAMLVCKTRIDQVGTDGSKIVVEPLGNHPVIKDLVVSLDSFFNQIRRVEPFIQPESYPESGEFLASTDAMNNLLTAMNCIMCGCCVSDCTVLEVDSNFIGPAALAKAWRFIEDPRDGKPEDRLKFLNDESGGIWDCTRCMQCVEVCPKDVDPMGLIMEMREKAITYGNRNTTGYRHTESFYKSVRKNGRLDESRLAIESAGWFNISRLLDLVPIGLKAMIRGKLPPLIPHKAESKDKIRDIYNKIESDKR